MKSKSNSQLDFPSRVSLIVPQNDEHNRIMSSLRKLSLSVVIPVFVKNAESFAELLRAIESIYRQQFRPQEVILSIENTDYDFLAFEKMINDYKDLNIRCIKNVGLKGISSNTNNGIARAESQFIHVLHQDDWLTNDLVYEQVIQVLQSNPKKYFLLSWKRLQVFGRPRFDLTAYLGNNHFGGPSGIIFPASSEIRFDENLSMFCDIDFLIQLQNAFGAPLVSELSSIEYGVSDGQAQNHISKDLFSRELIYLFSKHNPNKWRILLVALTTYKVAEIYGMVKLFEVIKNSFLFNLTCKFVLLIARMLSLLDRKIT
jgi:glycosyltransferase involved in cell wall biosynthesis